MDKMKNNRENAASVENEILAALSEFTEALEKGEVTKRLTCRQIKLNLEPASYDADSVKQVRKLLGVSQALFAKILGVSLRTVRAWEQGINTPNPMACRFMDEIRHDPAYWLERLKEATSTKASCNNS